MSTRTRTSAPEIRPVLSLIARLGFASRGTIYLVLGLLALMLAIGFTAESEDMRGTIEKISEQAFGRVIVLLLAIGLFSSGLWNAVQCVWDPERVATDWIGRSLRALFGAGAVLSVFLAYKTALVACGRDWGGVSGDEAVQSWTERVLGWPGGRGLVLLAAAIVAGVAVSFVVRLVRGKFMKAFSQRELKRRGIRVVKISAWLGFGARALMAGLVAWFLFRAGVTDHPEEAGGFTKALDTLLRQPFGRWLLGGTALGLMAQGLYIWLMVPYWEMQVRRPMKGMRTRWRAAFGG